MNELTDHTIDEILERFDKLARVLQRRVIARLIADVARLKAAQARALQFLDAPGSQNGLSWFDVKALREILS